MFWLNVNKISLGKIKQKTPQQTQQFVTLKTIRGLVSLVPKCFLGIFFPLPLVIVPEVFAKVNWSLLSEGISFPALFIDHFER